MNSLIPICSKTCQIETEACLLNPQQLLELYGFEGPHTVEKIKIITEEGEKWRIFLEEDGLCTGLIAWNDVGVEKYKLLDLHLILGHNLTIMPWQKLIFKSNTECGKYLTFIRPKN